MKRKSIPAKAAEDMTILSGIKKFGLRNELEVLALKRQNYTKMDLIEVLKATKDEKLKVAVRLLSKEIPDEDNETITSESHLFQDLTNMDITGGKWILKGMLQENELSLFFGEPGSRKSFVLLDMALHVSNGIDWNGFKNKQAPTVLYLIGEGQQGIKKRLAAASKRHGLPYNKILVSKLPGALISPKSAQAIGNAIKNVNGPVWLIVDTLHRNLGDGDENSSKDFGMMLNNIDKYIRSTGATVSIVHHTGHAEKGRSRGSSSIKGSLDSEFLVEADGDITTVECKKMKDAEHSKTVSLKANIEVLGEDEDGDLITSLSLTPSDYKKEKKSSEVEEIAKYIFDTLPLESNYVELEIQTQFNKTEKVSENIKTKIKKILIDEYNCNIPKRGGVWEKGEDNA